MRAAFFVLPVLLSFVLVSGGCSTPSIEGDAPIVGSSKGKTKKGKTTEAEGEGGETTEDQPTEPTPTTPPPNPGGTTPDAGTPPPPPTGACSASTTKEACFTCCEQQHPQGIQFLQQAFGNCACGTGAGNCSAECGGSWCAGAAPSALCEQCLNAADTCRLQADSACEQNATCNALFQCDSASQCASKP